MAWDPVCWMEVDENHAPETAEVAGRRVCFCSRGCRAIFERAPGTYWSPAVPAELERLPGLTKNLWWTWHPDAQVLFRSLGPPGSQSGGEPILLLRSLGAERLEACAKDAEVLERYRRVLAAFDTELRGDACWFGGRFPGLTAAPPPIRRFAGGERPGAPAGPTPRRALDRGPAPGSPEDSACARRGRCSGAQDI